MNKLSGKIFLSLAFAALVYIAFAVWGSIDDLRQAFSEFRWEYLPLILVLTLCNYLFRFANWQYYLKTLGVSIPRADSFLVYISGFSMSITPGKVGEVIRSFLLKEAVGAPVSKTGSLIIVDRLADVIALIVIAGFGAYSFEYGQGFVWALAAISLGSVILLSWRAGMEKALALMSRMRPLAKHGEAIRSLYESAATLLVPSRLFPILLRSLLGWSGEALGFYFTLQAFGADASVGSAAFIYAFSTLLGAASMLPGGLGLTEGSMAGLLVLLDIAKGTAAAATLVIRACTLWFGTVLGSIFLLIAQRKFATHLPDSNPAP